MYDPKNCDWCRIFGKIAYNRNNCNHIISCDQCGSLIENTINDEFYCIDCYEYKGKDIQEKRKNEGLK